MIYFREVIKISNKLNKITLNSTNGEIHCICKECCTSKWLIEDKEFTEKEVKSASKLEASKPLLLLRAE